jgi:hypothetical protein
MLHLAKDIAISHFQICYPPSLDLRCHAQLCETVYLATAIMRFQVHPYFAILHLFWWTMLDGFAEY